MDRGKRVEQHHIRILSKAVREGLKMTIAIHHQLNGTQCSSHPRGPGISIGVRVQDLFKPTRLYSGPATWPVSISS
jgi:hypothetical protein